METLEFKEMQVKALEQLRNCVLACYTSHTMAYFLQTEFA